MSSSMDSSFESAIESTLEDAMGFLEYLAQFYRDLEKLFPKKDEHTIEEYLETLALYPPALEEFVTPKDFMEAECSRHEGNDAFKIGDYKKAAIMYTKTLMRAPSYSKCAALAYANRSAALYHMKLYGDCISDIDRALELPYPENLKGKIISRREAAVADLKNDAANDTKTKDPLVDELKYAHGDNARMPGASCGIDIAYNPQEGRKLIARMPFQSGDILIVENPYLTVPELDEDPTFCHHCFKTTLCLIPCEKCNRVAYCSEKCRAEAYARYHRTECPIESTVTATFPLDVQGLMCQLRCLNVLTDQGADLKGLFDDVKEIEESSDPARLGFTGDNYLSDTRKALLSFMPGVKIKYNSKLWLEVTYLVVMLRNYSDFFKNNKDVVNVAKILLKLNLAYEVNHLSIPYAKRIEEKAHATFPLLGLAKHACVNNTITYVDDNGRVILRASQFIRPGDQIMFNYHDLQFSFEEAMTRTGRTVQCKRICKKCDKSYVYPPERQPYFKLDKRLRSKLQKNPYDIGGLWKVLNIVRGKHQHYTLQAQMVKTMLVEAYEGRGSLLGGHTQLHMFGIL